MQKVYKNILIIKPSAIGDIVTALPALRALRASYPSAKITWLVRSEFAALIQDHPDIDDLILFDRKLLGKFWCNRKSLSSFCQFLRRLRQSKFDLVIDFQGLFRTGFFAWITAAKDRCGMSLAREGATIFYNKTVNRPADSVHIVDYYMAMAKEITGKNFEVQFKLPIASDDQESVAEMLAEAGIVGNHYAVFVCGASKAEKCWPIQKFAELGQMLSETYGLEIVASGSGSEKVLADELAKTSKVKTHNFAGKTTMPQLKALLANAKLVVSNDTGPAHIAHAVGAPTIIVFGNTNPKRLGTYGAMENNICVDFQSRGAEIKSGNQAYSIENVEVEAVFARAKQIIETAS